MQDGERSETVISGAAILDPSLLFSALDFAARPATVVGGEGVSGGEVRDILAEFSDDMSLPKAVRKRLQIEHASAASA